MQESPFKRLRELCGITAPLFGIEADLSRQAINNIEAGMYTSVPLKANRALATLCSDRNVDAVGVLRSYYGEATLDKAMDAWKREKRQQQDLRGWPVLGAKELIARFPSPGAFCRNLCIPSSAIYHLIYGKSDVVPDVIREALTDAGYPYVEHL